MDTQPGQLAVVVIARNEEANIGRTLHALDTALAGLPPSHRILVDSGSTDRTVQIARTHPVQIFRYDGPPYTAAAGRRVGFTRTHARFVLFLDGDCCLERGWLEHALDMLAADERAAVVHGPRREIFPDTARKEDAPIQGCGAYDLGGNALYRSEALRCVGSFNPHLPAGEEGELLGRLLANGYRPLCTPTLMFTHYTQRKTEVAGFLARLRRGLGRGLGTTLRLAIGQGALCYHARRLNRYLITLAYLVLGAVTGLLSLALHDLRPLAVWSLVAAAGFLLLWRRRRSLREACFIVADWMSIALRLPIEFVRTPAAPEAFHPRVERLQ